MSGAIGMLLCCNFSKMVAVAAADYLEFPARAFQTDLSSLHLLIETGPGCAAGNAVGCGFGHSGPCRQA